MTQIIKIPGRIESAATGNVVTGANSILDDEKGKKQNVINSEIDAELLRLDQEKQNVLNFDNTPTEDSQNPVTSAGVFTADKALGDAIEAILLLIPSAASSLNQLADKNFVNSSISTATATPRGTYNLVSDLDLTTEATRDAIAEKLGEVIDVADLNDYAFVQIPVSDDDPTEIERTERYKFNGDAWIYEYTLNTSGFTAAQWDAINSGITTALVAKLNDLPTAEALELALGAITQNIQNISAVIPTEATVQNQLADKAYVLTQILLATPSFKGQYTTLTQLEEVEEPKAGDLGIVRTKDTDGHDVFTFYQYLNNQWNEYYVMSYHPQDKPATTGWLGDYPYNGMGRVELPMNMVEGWPDNTWIYLPKNDVVYLLYSWRLQLYAVYNTDTQEGLGLDDNLVVQPANYDIADIEELVDGHYLPFTEDGGVWTITKPDMTTITSTELNNTSIYNYNDPTHHGINVLTQAMINRPNTIYVIQYDFDLGGATITVPEKCMIQFEGGSLSNGKLKISDTSFTGTEKQVFKDITIDGVVDLPVEAFGVIPNNSAYAHINSDNFNAIKIGNSSHLRFLEGTYYFDARYPVTLTGNYDITGVGMTERQGTHIKIINAELLTEPTFMFTFISVRLSMTNIQISANSALSTEQIKNIGAVAILDPTGTNMEGNIDSAIDRCFFFHLGCPIYGRGRGLKITNCYFQEVGPSLLKQTQTTAAQQHEGDFHNQLPPYDGRDAWIEGNRFHVIYAGFNNFYNHYTEEQRLINSVRFAAFVFLRNPYVTNTVGGVTYESSFHQVVIRNNYCDSSAVQFLMMSPVKGLLFEGNAFVRTSNDPTVGILRLYRDAEQVVVSDNIITNFDDKPGSIVEIRGNISHLNICNNSVKARNLVRFLGLDDSRPGGEYSSFYEASFINIVGNNISECEDLISVTNYSIDNLFEDKNNVDFIAGDNTRDIVYLENRTNSEQDISHRTITYSSLHLVHVYIVGKYLKLDTNSISNYSINGYTSDYNTEYGITGSLVDRYNDAKNGHRYYNTTKNRELIKSEDKWLTTDGLDSSLPQAISFTFTEKWEKIKIPRKAPVFFYRCMIGNGGNVSLFDITTRLDKPRVRFERCIGDFIVSNFKYDDNYIYITNALPQNNITLRIDTITYANETLRPEIYTGDVPNNSCEFIRTAGTKAQRPSGNGLYAGFQYMQVDATYGTFPIWASEIVRTGAGTSEDPYVYTVTWIKADGTNPDV